jgi:hypothetical protein
LVAQGFLVQGSQKNLYLFYDKSQKEREEEKPSLDDVFINYPNLAE